MGGRPPQHLACEPVRLALLYALMEPLRPRADRQALEFIRSGVFTPRDFVIDSKGVCRLHPQLAGRLVGLVGDRGDAMALASLLR